MFKSNGAIAAFGIVVSFSVPVFATDEPRIQVAGVKSVSVAQKVSSNVDRDPATKALDVAIGDTLPLQYMMAINTDRLNLPRPKDGWVYFEVGRHIFKVELNSRLVLEHAAFMPK